MKSPGGLLREIPEDNRPRERLERFGSAALTDAELLAILLRTGLKGLSVVQLGEKLLKHYGGLESLMRCSVREMSRIPGIGNAKATALRAAFDLHERISSRKMLNRPLDNPKQIYELMAERVRFLNVEVLFGLALDSKLRLLRCYEVTSGLTNQTLAHPREVFREAIAASAVHLVLVHNHPSGDPKPSPDDIRTTREMKRAGEVLGVPLLDHVIIGRPSVARSDSFISLKQMGILGE
ncbi:MAG: DNA repair protein RadC [Verrucomicrobia bacterium]|nr:DNA repair protein RadC [Verrucomicrobiota bacterium]